MDNIIDQLKSDQSLEYWLRYSYIRMADYPRNSIEGIVDHFHRSGYNDSKIYEIAKSYHTCASMYPKLAAS